MTTGCVTATNYTSGAQLTGLTAGSSYFATITAISSDPALRAGDLGRVGVRGPRDGPAERAGHHGGHRLVDDARRAHDHLHGLVERPGRPDLHGQGLHRRGDDAGCVTAAGYTSGAQLTGLVQGTGYYVTVAANASAGYLTATSSVAGPTNSTIQLTAPTGVTLAFGVGRRVDQRSPTPARRTPRRPDLHGQGLHERRDDDRVRHQRQPRLGRGPHRPRVHRGLRGHELLRHRHGERLARLPRVGAVRGRGPQADTSQLNAPGTPAVAPRRRTAGAITATFTASSGVAPASYTATACTNAAMTTGCVTQPRYTSGTQFTGLVAGHELLRDDHRRCRRPATSRRPGDLGGRPTLATVQLTAPTGVTLAYGTVAGSIAVTFTGSSNAPGGQTYTAKACTDAGMTTGCVTNATHLGRQPHRPRLRRSGSAGTSYYVTVTRERVERLPRVGRRRASAGPQADTSQLNAPGTPDGRLVDDHGRRDHRDLHRVERAPRRRATPRPRAPTPR